MVTHRGALIGAAMSSLMLFSTTALGAVSAEEAARLQGDLTPLGAERAGNADGTIPAWDGGLQTAPEGVVVTDDLFRPDPFADDEPLYRITAENYTQYQDQLMPVHIALFESQPTYFMDVYQSRRSCALPDFVYDAIQRNALNASITEDGNGVLNATMATPFPFPTRAEHVTWNHTLRYRGFNTVRQFASVAPAANGTFTPVIVQDQAIFLYSDPTVQNMEELENTSFKYLQTVISPARRAGDIILVHESLDQSIGARNAWTYNPGQRRVRRAPTIAYDNPQSYSDGLSTADQLDMYNGAPDRYTWEMLGKEEYIVPYNTYELQNVTHEYSDIAQPNHLNQDLIRYEPHRVWVVEAGLLPDARHIYGRRVHYHDEDTYQIVGSALYDSRGEMWRVMEGFMINFYDVPACFTVGEVSYDLQNGRYSVQGLMNQEPQLDFNGQFTEDDFNPNALRRGGIR